LFSEIRVICGKYRQV